VKLRLLACTACAFVLTFISACLPIPHRHTRNAGASFTVTNQRGQPIPNARVFTYDGVIINNLLRRRDSATTDAAGLAKFERQREWHMIILLIPDAEAPRVFGWCAEARGHRPLIRSMADENEQDVSAPLVPSGSAAHCPLELEQHKLEDGSYLT
jgi:hypothetical protein